MQWQTPRRNLLGMNEIDLTYPDGLTGVLDRFEGRRAPFDFGAETLPPADAALEPLTVQIVAEDAARLGPGSPNTSWARKRARIAEEFVGSTELAFLNAQLIANLRKRDFPTQCPTLFQRLWAEQSAHLLQVLDLRWLVSSVQTFADHGMTPTQREVGHALRMLFGLVKLYEFERLFSGHPPSDAFRLRHKVDAALPMGMEGFSLDSGGLDINLIAPIWSKALTDPTIAPLANHLLNRLNADPGTVFRRLKLMREMRAARQRARQ
ncbi:MULTISPECIES: hypothetical protein [unclassified Ruegeria]|uniref:hypothetical protein n=1 Tax=unclassified Ruegeria TaxID=2625375 RepID=UPI0014899E37|nr:MULTISPECIES: hypothetical protein [unclassified Ruegeria]